MDYSCNFGLSQRHIETMLINTLTSSRHELFKEYSNALYRQGRARDTSIFSREEEDMLAMCDAYSLTLFKNIARVIDSNNKKMQEDILTMINPKT